MTLRTRLVLAAAYLLVVVVIAFEVPVAVTIDRRGVAELRAELLKQTAVAAARVGDPLAAIARRRRRQGVDRGAGRHDREPDRRARRGRGPGGARGRRQRRRGGPGDPVRHRRPSRVRGGARRAGHVLHPPLRHGRGRPGGRDGSGLGRQTVVGAVRSTAPLNQVRANVHRAWIGLAGIGLAVIWWVGARLAARDVAGPAGAGARPRRVDLGAGDLDARATPEGPEEIASLADVVQPHGVGARLDRPIAARLRRERLAPAAHPLTGLRLRLEAVQAEGGPAAAEEAGKALAEVDRLSALVDDLFACRARRRPARPASRPTWPRSRGTRSTAGTVRPGAPA